MNKTQIEQAADLLLAARQPDATPVDTSTLSFAPQSLDEVYAIQSSVAARLGEVGAWKTGADTAEAIPAGAPIFAATISSSPTRIACGSWHLIGIEAELAFRLGADLPCRESAYTQKEVADAVDCMLPLIELVNSRLLDFNVSGDLWKLADNQINAGLVLGEPILNWQELDTSAQHVHLTAGDTVLADTTGWNFPDSPLGLTTRFINRFCDHCGGIKAGQIITTGSLTGIDFVAAGQRVVASFDNLGDIILDLDL